MSSPKAHEETAKNISPCARLDDSLNIALLFLCATWIAGLAYLVLAFRRLPRLEREKFPEPDTWPRLSIVVPACNEAAHLESAIQTLLSADYPEFEVILVDDRSTDGTGAIIDRLAKHDRRVRAIHIDILPEGWLGKVHALHRGVSQARGEWLLFTDADVHFAPGVLRQALGYARHQQADHLALIPRTLQSGFWLDIIVQTFGLLFLIATRAAGANRAGSKTFVGIGAFNLVKSEALRRTPGLEWLRLEPGDDVGLGMMINRAGGVSRLALGHGFLTVEWYPSVAAMFRGLEKNLFGPGSNYHWWLMVLQVAGLWSLAAAPWIALIIGMMLGTVPVLAAGLCVFAAQSLFALCCVNNRREESFGLLFVSFGLIVIGAMLLSAGLKCLRNGGIEWRGTRYPLAQLRQGQRVKFLVI